MRNKFVKEVSGFTRTHAVSDSKARRKALWRLFTHLTFVQKHSAAQGVLARIDKTRTGTDLRIDHRMH
ncbi:MAG: hypothetical protein RLZZ283_406 [Candidatus Parcubacteria bacterium]|jgi:hypothetical protein